KKSSSAVGALAFSPDGKTLASGTWPQTVILWDVKTGRLKQRLAGHSDEVISVAFSPDGTVLASGSRDKTILLWDMETGRLEARLMGDSDEVISVAFSPDGKTLASGSGHKVVLWETPSAAVSAAGRLRRRRAAPVASVNEAQRAQERFQRPRNPSVARPDL